MRAAHLERLGWRKVLGADAPLRRPADVERLGQLGDEAAGRVTPQGLVLLQPDARGSVTPEAWKRNAACGKASAPAERLGGKQVSPAKTCSAGN